VDAIEDKIGEALLGPIEPDAETDDPAIEIQRADEIMDIKFGNEARHRHGRLHRYEKAARDLVSRGFLFVPRV
jgi:SOS response regulatory protein OraA/RecX